MEPIGSIKGAMRGYPRRRAGFQIGNRSSGFVYMSNLGVPNEKEGYPVGGCRHKRNLGNLRLTYQGARYPADGLLQEEQETFGAERRRIGAAIKNHQI